MESTSSHREAARWRRSGLWGQLFLSFSLLSSTAILALAWLSAHTCRSLLEQEAVERMIASATTTGEWLAAQWPEAPDERTQRLVRRLGQETGVRVTLLALGGQVLADSHWASLADVIQAESHGHRPEFVAALKNGAGSARRVSPTVGERYRYYARRIECDGQPVGVVRTALPTATIEAELANLTRPIWTSGVVLAAAAIGMAYWIAARLIAPLRQLAATADALSQGEYDRRLPVAVGADDELSIVAGALNEIGKQLARRERQLRSSSQTQATVLDAMTESVIAVDRYEKVLFANASAARALDFNAVQVVGHPLLEAARSHELRAVLHKALKTNQPGGGEIAWRGKTRRIFDVLATPLPGDPSPGVVLVLRDVSEMKRLEQMRQQFIANVSHELKTPLSSIKAYAETLLGGASEDPVHCRRFVERIDEQAARLHQLIIDMLSLARIESSQAPLELVDVPLARVVRRSLADHESQAAAAQVALENQIVDDSILVRADEEALRQILGNLIDNAVKYTPAGGRVTVSCRVEGGVVSCNVADTGAGIPAEHHSRVFERFYRVDKARSRELGGTGLGLSIVKHLSQAMGGSVSMTSELGKGSVFSVQLSKGGG